MAVAFLKNMIDQGGPKFASLLLSLFSVLSITALSFNRSPYIESQAMVLVFYSGLVLALGLLAYYLSGHRRCHLALFAAIFSCVIYAWLALLVFGAGYCMHMMTPLFAVILALLAGSGLRYQQQERDARELQPAIVQQAKIEAAETGGDSREVTIIFTDIKGFTSFSEKHTPQEVVHRLNEYLGEMVRVIEEYDGYVDKFIGDGIMAYWGAPLLQADHAQRAVSCVLAMQRTMARLCAQWQAGGLEPFSIRAGVQSGEVVAGNLGLKGRKMEYTVIGDTVNQAARLEGSAKYYGVEVLVGENTYMSTRDNFAYRELDKIRMAGKQVPVTVYELSEPQSAGKTRLNGQFAAALTVYRARQWDAAEKAFAAILVEFPHDKASKMYLERCQYFIKNPVSAGWDGVFNRRGK